MDDMSRSGRRPPQRATFRLPAPALFFPVLLMFCITPLATSGGAWALTFAVPVIALAWVLLTRTKATPTKVTAYGLLGAKSMMWTGLAGLEFRDARWAIAVGLDGRRVRLPMVRPRDLPRLAAVSGGSLNLDGPAERDGQSDPEEMAEHGSTAAGPVGERTAEPDQPSAGTVDGEVAANGGGRQGDGSDPSPADPGPFLTPPPAVPGEAPGDSEERSRSPRMLAPTIDTPTISSAPAAPNAPSV